MSICYLATSLTSKELYIFVTPFGEEVVLPSGNLFTAFQKTVVIPRKSITYQLEKNIKMKKKTFFDILETKSYGMVKLSYSIDFQWLKPKGGLPTTIHYKKD